MSKTDRLLLNHQGGLISDIDNIIKITYKEPVSLDQGTFIRYNPIRITCVLYVLEEIFQSIFVLEAHCISECSAAHGFIEEYHHYDLEE